MKPWLRLDQDAHYDAKVRKARAGAVWPWVLTRLKRGEGVASAEDIDAFAAADGCSIPEELAAAQLAGLRTVGLLVETDVGWTTPRWSEHQADPTAAERQRKSRARNSRASADADTRAAQRAAVTDVTVTGVTDRDVTDVTVTGVTDRDVTDVTVTHSESRPVTARHGCHAIQDRTVQDRRCIEGEADEFSRSGGPDTARARDDHDDGQDQDRRDRAMLRTSHERRAANAAQPALAASLTPATPSVDPSMAAAVAAWRRTDSGAAPLSSAVVDRMRRVIAEHGAARVIEALDVWTGTDKGTGFAPPRWIASVCERISADEAAAEAARIRAEADEARQLDELAEARERKARADAMTPAEREAAIETAKAHFAEMRRMLDDGKPTRFGGST